MSRGLNPNLAASTTRGAPPARPHPEGPSGAGVRRKTEDWGQLFRQLSSGLGDLEVVFEDLCLKADGSSMRWTLRGVHRAPLLGIAATSRRVVVTGTASQGLTDSAPLGHWSPEELRRQLTTDDGESPRRPEREAQELWDRATGP